MVACSIFGTFRNEGTTKPNDNAQAAIAATSTAVGLETNMAFVPSRLRICAHPRCLRGYGHGLCFGPFWTLPVPINNMKLKAVMSYSSSQQPKANVSSAVKDWHKACTLLNSHYYYKHAILQSVNKINSKVMAKCWEGTAALCSEI